MKIVSPFEHIIMHNIKTVNPPDKKDILKGYNEGNKTGSYMNMIEKICNGGYLEENFKAFDFKTGLKFALHNFMEDGRHYTNNKEKALELMHALGFSDMEITNYENEHKLTNEQKEKIILDAIYCEADFEVRYGSCAPYTHGYYIIYKPNYKALNGFCERVYHWKNDWYNHVADKVRKIMDEEQKWTDSNYNDLKKKIKKKTGNENIDNIIQKCKNMRVKKG